MPKLLTEKASKKSAKTKIIITDDGKSIINFKTISTANNINEQIFHQEDVDLSKILGNKAYIAPAPGIAFFVTKETNYCKLSLFNSEIITSDLIIAINNNLAMELVLCGELIVKGSINLLTPNVRIKIGDSLTYRFNILSQQDIYLEAADLQSRKEMILERVG